MHDKMPLRFSSVDLQKIAWAARTRPKQKTRLKECASIAEIPAVSYRRPVIWLRPLSAELTTVKKHTIR